MGYQRQYKSDARYAQKRRREVAEIDEQQSAKAHDPFALSPNNILNLQRTIGNQAVQRLIRQVDVLQRQPTDTRDSQKQTSLPSVVASITGAFQGKFKGGSRIAGHEGKIEVLSLSLDPSGKDKMTVHLTKEVDDSSTALFKAMLAGEPLTGAQFDFIRSNEEGNIETVKTFEFTNGIITSIQHSGTGDVPTESISIEFILEPEKK